MKLLLIYAFGVRLLRHGLAKLGWLVWLERRAKASRKSLWLRSLLSVLDFDDFRSLDLPWWTFSASTRVADHLKKNPHSRVFEWGAGASTVWLGKRAAEVISIESDQKWASAVKSSIGPHVRVVWTESPLSRGPGAVRSKRWGFRGRDFQSYVNAIDSFEGMFDLIVIDGRAREACFAKALTRLSPSGLVVFDNTNRRRYRRALATHHKLIDVESFSGLTPILPWPSTTALVSRRKSLHDQAARETESETVLSAHS